MQSCAYVQYKSQYVDDVNVMVLELQTREERSKQYFDIDLGDDFPVDEQDILYDRVSDIATHSKRISQKVATSSIG